VANKSKTYYEQKVTPALAPAARSAAATVNGADINRQGFEALLFVLSVGTWTDGTHTYKLQEAPDNGAGAPGAYTDVALTDQVGAFAVVSAAGNSNTTQKVGYIGAQKFVRMAVTTAGATTGAVSGAAALLGSARNLPQ
jgi:hypothetical protein